MELEAVVLVTAALLLAAFACGYSFYRLQLRNDRALNRFLARRGVTLALVVGWALMLAPGPERLKARN